MRKTETKLELCKRMADDYIIQSSGLILLRDIVLNIEDYFFNEYLGKQPKNIKLTVSSYVRSKVKNDPQYSIIKKTPFSFIRIKELNSETTKEIKQFLTDEITHERDLHDHLANFLLTINIQSTTIFHETSSKDESIKLKWLHPDMVGFTSISHIEKNVLDLSKKLNDSIIEIYSFELKRDLNLSNLSSYFFQAVSNSSWAHFGYLVVEDIT